jgi:ubiquinone/menaquinone biosynthesis C-methylase UbiE
MPYYVSASKDLSKPDTSHREIYFRGYADLERFISYFYQINLVIKVNPTTVLEVGVGNRVVSDYLIRSGYQVTTVDINRGLEPHAVGDIRNLPFGDNLFDVVLASEVLEHLPFKDVPNILAELRRVSQKEVIISIPYSCFFTENVLNVKTPLFSKQLRFVLSVPFFTSEFKRTGEHHWEMGRKNYPKKIVKRLLEKYFRIRDEFQPVLNPYHYFFILDKIAN